MDIDAARLYSPASPRLLILQTNTGRHAITFFVGPSGEARRFDNDDLARVNGTFTWVTWDTIIHEWGASASNAMYGLVQAGSPLTMTNRARVALEREHRRQRVRALEYAGVHDPRERERILRTEDRHTAQIQAALVAHPQPRPTPAPMPMPMTVPMTMPLPMPILVPVPMPVPVSVSGPMPTHVPILVPVMARMPMLMPMPSQPPIQPPLLSFTGPHLPPYATIAPTFASPSSPTGVPQLPPLGTCVQAPAHNGTQPQLQTHLHSHSQPHPHVLPRARAHNTMLVLPPANIAHGAATTASPPPDHMARHPQSQPPSTATHPHLQPLRSAVHDASPADMAVLVPPGRDNI